LLVTANNRLKFEIEIVHDLLCHPILSQYMIIQDKIVLSEASRMYPYLGQVQLAPSESEKGTANQPAYFFHYAFCTAFNATLKRTKCQLTVAHILDAY